MLNCITALLPLTTITLVRTATTIGGTTMEQSKSLSTNYTCTMNEFTILTSDSTDFFSVANTSYVRYSRHIACVMLPW